MKVLVFDIWGDYAHFRKFYTTTSPLSFSFPPPPTLAGILGAIYGTAKETNQYLKIFGSDDSFLALRILNPVKKVRMGINLIDTKKAWFPRVRTQIRTEFVKSPRYRVYFSHRDEQVYADVLNLIREHRAVYTIALGLSELLADFAFQGEYQAQPVSTTEPEEIVTPITEQNLLPDGLVIETGKKYVKEKIPILMNTNREVTQYENVIFEADGKPLRAAVNNHYRLENGERITCFWTLFSSRNTT